MVEAKKTTLDEQFEELMMDEQMDPELMGQI